MHRGPNPDYQRAPVAPPRYGASAAPGAGPPFPGPFTRTGFPPHYPNPVSYPRSVPPPGFQSFSTEQSYQAAAPPAQFSAGWTLQQDELQNLEVKKKAEEFLRMLETKASGESGDKVTRRPSADTEAERHGSEKHSRGRSRSRSRSRGRSRGRSRAKSRAHSRGRSRARSRSRSRSRGKSRTRAKSRPRSRSRSRGRSFARSKSQPRLHKDSQRSIKDTASPSVSSRVPDLFQNLKQVLQSKELEKHLSVVKNTFMINQTQEDMKIKQETAPSQNLPEFLMKSCDPERAADFTRNSVLPHERVSGSDGTLPRILSWNEPGQKLESFPNKCVFSSIEDEEEFLYGEDDARKKPQAVTVPLAQTRPAENPISSFCISKPSVLQEPKGQAVTPSQRLTPDVSVEECERVKNLLKTIGLNLSQADIVKMAARLKQKQEEQRGASSNPTLRATLETLLNRNKVQKSDDGRSNRSESSHSHRESDHRESEEMEREKEKERREKQIQKKRKEYLVKELEGLLKHEGSGDLIPVIGFFCQRCEEFFADLTSAEGHKHTNTHQDQQLKDNKRQREHKPMERRDRDERSSETKRSREDSHSPHRTEDKSRVQETKARKEDDGQSSKSSKKKKKKEKKKKDKKKEKKKDKSEKN
ncbi:zinc finger protein 318 isoform X2 [Hemibagrus wyckioides]|uniref:zinc finger protein 318 isoform X2 n=1 Tax=Hemibagrus wyckioides TaxID=337641 RepID=UPI00266D001E|nr:zinc finger protein 318 isoform X2 [Hemibagrus wyckioides]